MAEMRRVIHTILMSGLACTVLAGCGDEPAVRTYEVAKPVAYAWPKTEAREQAYEEDNVAWVWDVPAGWVDAPEVPEQLVADYRFKGVDEDLPGRMTLSVISGDAGGVMANVARWRQQMFSMPVTGLGPKDLLSRPMPAPAGELTIVELEGQYRGPHEPTYLLGAILRVPATDGSTYQTWFFKMVGDRPTIQENRLALAKMFLSFRPKGTDPVSLPPDFFLPGTGAPGEDAPDATAEEQDPPVRDTDEGQDDVNDNEASEASDAPTAEGEQP